MTSTFSHSLKIYPLLFEDDLFNHLLEKAGLSYVHVVVVRTYSKALKYMGCEELIDTIAKAFIEHAGFSQNFIQLFKCRFDPNLEYRDEFYEQALEACYQSLKEILDLEASKIFHKALNLLLATVRTNLYQNGQDLHQINAITLKFDSQKIEFLPKPFPLYEIFVYSPRLEACHLRSSKVSRGGIRWSDHLQDLRYEILSLMKTQTMKNSVIVPMGSKGGFFCKHYETLKNSGASKEHLRQEVIECYQIFIKSLLSLTDNFQQTVVIKPFETICYDGNDPYLVVAADKGTADFSDIANQIAEDHHFWLGDAFASGGSKGFNHRAMGITSQGAWISVRRHFYELGIDCQSQPITVIGIGDMSGDVFGNGMLQSKMIKLIAAFNHQHIFLDPSPDPLISYLERQRLFNLPGSSWANYNTDLISAGGGIFSRSESMITLSQAFKEVLGIKDTIDSITPAELISLLLKASVDLLWFGGIGTYVKASSETTLSIHDAPNDAVRINAKDLEVKVIGEGANLALTQPARIEYALQGGRLNTDAIDNSAGVSCSDHEVNLKLLFSVLKENLDFTAEKRTALLHSLTPQVVDLILADNFKQTLLLSLEEYALQTSEDSIKDFQNYQSVINFLGHQSDLHFNSKLEGLPNDEQFHERQDKKQPLTRPERAVVTAYVKIYLYQNFLKIFKENSSNLYMLENEFPCYFPDSLQKQFKTYFNYHPLKIEIIATILANQVVNVMGPCWCIQTAQRSKKSEFETALKFNKIWKENGWHKDWEALSQETFQKNPQQIYRKLLQLKNKLNYLLFVI